MQGLAVMLRAAALARVAQQKKRNAFCLKSRSKKKGREEAAFSKSNPDYRWGIMPLILFNGCDLLPDIPNSANAFTIHYGYYRRIWVVCKASLDRPIGMKPLFVHALTIEGLLYSMY